MLTFKTGGLKQQERPVGEGRLLSKSAFFHSSDSLVNTDSCAGMSVCVGVQDSVMPDGASVHREDGGGL